MTFILSFITDFAEFYYFFFTYKIFFINYTIFFICVNYRVYRIYILLTTFKNTEKNY